MVFGGLFLPGVTIEAVGIEEVALVVGRVVAYLASADARLPARLFSDGVPATLVPAAAAAELMRLMHERVVERAETYGLQRRLVGHRRIAAVARIDGHRPRDVGHHGVHVFVELLLEGFGGEDLADVQRGAVDVVLRPMSESHLEESQSAVVGIAACEVGVELKGEPLQLGVGPVGIPRGAVVVGVLGEGLGVVWPLLDVGRDCRRSALAVDVAARRVFVAEAGDELMPATGDVFEHAVEPAPVVLYGAVLAASGDDLAGQTIGELQLDGLPVGVVQTASRLRPQHQSRHRLRVRDVALQLHGSPRLLVAGTSRIDG